MKKPVPSKSNAANGDATSTERIYCLSAATARERDRLERALSQAAAMGFDTVLLASSTLHAPSGDEAERDYGIDAVADACRTHTLSLYLDFAVDLLPTSGTLPPELLDARQDGPVDPQHIFDETNAIRIIFDAPQTGPAAAAWWRARLGDWMRAGVAGFRCERLQHAPAALWKEIIDGVRADHADCRFLGWTPGLSPAELHAVGDCGFDAVFSSTAWWDFRADWLFEEDERLRRLGPVIAVAEPPAGPRLASRLSPRDDCLPAYRRALWLAAFAGDGMLVPAGFEFGSTLPLDTAETCSGRSRPGSSPLDLFAEIAEANAFLAGSFSGDRSALLALAGPGGPIAALLRIDSEKPADATRSFLLVANADLHRPNESDTATLFMRSNPLSAFVGASGGEALSPGQTLRLAPGEVRLYSAEKRAPILIRSQGRRPLNAALQAPRIAIENIRPSVEGGRFPVKRLVGDSVTVEADVFADGHDELAACLLWRSADTREWSETRMEPAGNDRWRARLPLTRLGAYVFTIEAWRDDFSTVKSRLKKKQDAGVAIGNELEEARKLLAEASSHDEKRQTEIIRQALAAFDADADATARARLLSSGELADAMSGAAPRHFSYRCPETRQIWAERAEAAFASWYELFPRSQSGDPMRHGTFDDVIARLPAIREMGFDVLYMPPIHPIGRTNRKGRNNALTAEPGDPGSPYAIGGAEGGHTAIHPDLGTIDDFRRLRDAAKEMGIEIALDFAIQCSPDHPWVKEHPEWFKWQPDGSLHYAENPPKTYEDITNVEFYTEDGAPELWLALRDVVLFWIAEGVKTFRVDNPHTKPFPFWEWMIAEVRARHPDAIFLAEAFTAPKRMDRLAKLGFSQSYTYFTWRHGKAELTEYLTHLAQDDVRDYFRPHFFVNTPDINPVFLQTSGRAGHLIRAALATLTSGLWGMYSGFELCEATPLPGREEYLNSEKYEIRAWDWERPGNIIGEITALNRARKANPALQSHLGLSFYNAFNDQILYFAKATPARDNVVLAAINLDPFHPHEALIELPLWEWGLPDDAALEAEDLMRGHTFTWYGKTQTLRLDPGDLPFALWRVRPVEAQS